MCSLIPGWEVQVPGSGASYSARDVWGSNQIPAAIRPNRAEAISNLISEAWSQTPAGARTTIQVVSTAVACATIASFGMPMPSFGVSATAVPVSAFGQALASNPHVSAFGQALTSNPHVSAFGQAFASNPHTATVTTASGGFLASRVAGVFGATIGALPSALGLVRPSAEDGTSSGYRSRGAKWDRMEQDALFYRMFAGDEDVVLFNPLDPDAPERIINGLFTKRQITEHERDLMLSRVYKPTLAAIEEGEYPYGASGWALGLAKKEFHEHTFKLGDVAEVYTAAEARALGRPLLAGDLKTEVGQKACELFEVVDVEIPEWMIEEYAATLLVEAGATVKEGEMTWQDFLAWSSGITDINAAEIRDHVKAELVRCQCSPLIWAKYLRLAKAQLEDEGGAATLQARIGASDVIVDTAIKLGMPEEGCANILAYLAAQPIFQKAISSEHGVVPDPALKEMYECVLNYGFTGRAGLTAENLHALKFLELYDKRLVYGEDEELKDDEMVVCPDEAAGLKAETDGWCRTGGTEPMQNPTRRVPRAPDGTNLGTGTPQARVTRLRSRQTFHGTGTPYRR